MRLAVVSSYCMFIISSLAVATLADEELLSPKARAVWPPSTKQKATVKDLHNEYGNIFRFGNRNAASHRWSTFLLERSHQMTSERLDMFFTGFCAVSGSPVRPTDYNRYRLTLPRVGRTTTTTTTDDRYNTTTTTTTTTTITGYMHYCCWPCVCDTQDFIRVDTRNVTTRDGVTHSRHFAVIGNPCDHPEQLETPFHQPFGRGTTTTLKETAQEVRCLPDGTMEGATLSDHGYIIIAMFFDASNSNDDDDDIILIDEPPPPQPGRVSSVKSKKDGSNILFQDEREWGPHCTERAENGYNSGMGEIFRKVCAISPIPQNALALPSGQEQSCEATGA